MRQIVVRTLRQAGYDDVDVVEAEDGADCLAKVGTEAPDLVLSDWNMPNMLGIDCLRALRARGSAVPFGFVTSEGSPEMRDDGPPPPARCSSSPSRSPRTPSARRWTRCWRERAGRPPRCPATKAVLDLLQGLLGREITVGPGAPVTPSASPSRRPGLLRRPAVRAERGHPHRPPAVGLVRRGAGPAAQGWLRGLGRGGRAHRHAGRGAARGGQRGRLAVQRRRRAALEAGQAVRTGEALPADLGALTASTNRVDIDVTVGGYGKGSLSIILA